jgi:hypothetical protein
MHTVGLEIIQTYMYYSFAKEFKNSVFIIHKLNLFKNPSTTFFCRDIVSVA